MNNNFWKYASIRALKTFCQALVCTLPAGATITPAMIQTLDWSILYVIGAWIGTALFGAFLSFVTSVATGLPEVELENNMYMNADEPIDSEVEDDEDE